MLDLTGQQCYWTVFDDDQFYRAINCCIDFRPSTLICGDRICEGLSLQDAVRLRLGEDMVNELLTKSVRNLGPDHDLEAEDVLRAPRPALLDLVKRVDDLPYLGAIVTHLALSAGTDRDGKALWGEFEHRVLSSETTLDQLAQWRVLINSLHTDLAKYIGCRLAKDYTPCVIEELNGRQVVFHEGSVYYPHLFDDQLVDKCNFRKGDRVLLMPFEDWALDDEDVLHVGETHLYPAIIVPAERAAARE